MTDTRTTQVKDFRIRFLAEINPPLAVKRQRGARAVRDNARSISCVQHPSSTHGHMENWRVQENIQTIVSNVKQMKCVSPSSRTLATCASTASASTSYRFSLDVSLDKADPSKENTAPLAPELKAPRVPEKDVHNGTHTRTPQSLLWNCCVR